MCLNTLQLTLISCISTTQYNTQQLVQHLQLYTTNIYFNFLCYCCCTKYRKEENDMLIDEIAKEIRDSDDIIVNILKNTIEDFKKYLKTVKIIITILLAIIIILFCVLVKFSIF